MFDTVLGIPVHALVVHAVVVLAPLVALLLVLVAVSEKLRARIGIVLPLLATVTAGAGFVAKESGEALERRLSENDLIEKHAELGDVLPIILIAVAVLTWVIYLVWRRTARDAETGARRPSVLLRALLAVGVLAAIGLAVDVTLVGHSGAKAVWDGVGSQPAPQGGEGGDD